VLFAFPYNSSIGSCSCWARHDQKIVGRKVVEEGRLVVAGWYWPCLVGVLGCQPRSAIAPRAATHLGSHWAEGKAVHSRHSLPVAVVGDYCSRTARSVVEDGYIGNFAVEEVCRSRSHLAVDIAAAADMAGESMKAEEDRMNAAARRSRLVLGSRKTSGVYSQVFRLEGSLDSEEVERRV
jgi:hypothetical protein